MNEDHVVIVDISGSTAVNYEDNRNPKLLGKTVLQREMEIAEEIVLKNHGTTRIFSFAEFVSLPIELKVNRTEGLVQMPTYSSGSITNTHMAFRQINQLLQKPKSITVITDGESNSKPTDLKNEIEKIISSKIKITVVAVSAKNIDMNIVSNSEEKTIPGMDLINILGNAINTLLIYNQFHKDEPFIGASSSEMDKMKLVFMDQPLNTSIPEFIHKLVSILDTNKSINWGSNYIDFKKMVSEIGKLITALFPIFPERHPFIEMICSKLTENSNIPDMTISRVLGLLTYGFEATKNSQPIILTNVEQHVKEASVKVQQFADAISELKQKGSTCGQAETIGIGNGIIVLNKGALKIVDSLGVYPFSMDKDNNIVYFTTDSSFIQATRIFMREFCGKIIGFPNSTGSPNVIFYVASKMLLMFLSGCTMDSIYMKELQKLAIIQTSMDVMVSKGKYSGKPLFQMWKDGMLPKIHFSKNDVHTSLYTDKLINPLGLSELIWWAAMMSMLGIFDSQIPTYAQALASNGISSNEEAFLVHIKNSFSDRVIGNIQCVSVDHKPSSVFTLGEFGEDDIVYQLSDHGTGNMHCSTKTLYSETEKDWVERNGCVWCKQRPSRNDFIAYEIKDPLEKVKSTIAISKPMLISSENNGSNVHLMNSSLTQITDELKSIDIQRNNIRHVCINLLGITGSGKSTYSVLLKTLIERKHLNASVLIVSSDKWKKLGLDDVSNIRQELTDLDKVNSTLKIVIVDLCNDRGIKKILFGYNMSHYESYTVCPNMNKEHFSDYEHWCLENVLARHASGPYTNYMLSPITSGLKTCIEVHNMKTRGIKAQVQNNKPREDINVDLSMSDVQDKIRDGAKRYAQYLATQSLEADIMAFLNSITL